MEGIEKTEVTKEVEKVYNAYDQLKRAAAAGLSGPFIVIAYMSDTRRGGIGRYWVIDKPGYILDKEAHWSLRGQKAFWLQDWRKGELEPKDGSPKAASLALAQAWVKEKFGEVKWARNKRGDYVPEHINKAFPVTPLAQL